MAEAIYHGKTAQAYWKPSGGVFAAIVNLIGWTFSGKASSAESTVMNIAAHFGKTREIGFKGCTATVTTNLPAGDTTIHQGNIGTLQLLRTGADAAKGYASATDGAICTGVAVGVDKDGIETLTYSFQFTGAISNTVTEGA